ncbi:unannotated protein [freshwater metagenome]|uniref:Unannotated protein n=1 Tax=freshwater metagenome TaxID=449393 RepID=A0A6J6HIP2_9ZZZZ
MAVFEIALSALGAAYATVSVLPLPMTEPRVNCTVEPETTALFTVTGDPFAVTVKEDGDAVVELSASLYVSVTVVPDVLIAAELNTGGTPVGITADEAVDTPDVLSPFNATDVKV